LVSAAWVGGVTASGRTTRAAALRPRNTLGHLLFDSGCRAGPWGDRLSGHPCEGNSRTGETNLLGTAEATRVIPERNLFMNPEAWT